MDSRRRRRRRARGRLHLARPGRPGAALQRLRAAAGQRARRAPTCSRSARRAGVDIGEVYRVDASRRVDLAERLRRRHRPDQAGRPLRQPARRRRTAPSCDSVVAHELGHVAHDDIRRGLAFVALVAPLGLLFAARARPARRAPRAAPSPARPAAMPAYLLAIALAGFVLNVPGNQLSREVEASADTFALELTDDPQALIDLQTRLARRTSPTPTRRGCVSSCSAPTRRRSSGSAPRVAYERDSAGDGRRNARAVRGRGLDRRSARALQSELALQPSSPRRARVDRDPLDLAEPGGAISGSNVVAARGRDRSPELEHARLDPGADVEGARRVRPRRRRGRRRRRRRRRCSRASARRRRRPSACRRRAARRRRSRPRRLAVRVLARAVDVAEAQRDRVEAVEAAVEVEVALGGELRLPVRGVGPALGVLGERQLAALALAVDRAAGRGEDEPAAAEPGAPRSSRLIVPPTLTPRS